MGQGAALGTLWASRRPLDSQLDGGNWDSDCYEYMDAMNTCMVNSMDGGWDAMNPL